MTEKNETGKPGFLSILILVLSVYVLAALMIDTFVKLPHEVSRVLKMLDDIICIVFLYDFFYRLYHAKNKWHFMKWGWIDLVSSIPTLEFMRAGRALRMIRILRTLRAFRSIRHLVHHVFRKKVKGTLATAVIIAVLMVIFSSVAILQVEVDPKSNIKTAEDALWWSYVTITSVGYGDKYPVTTLGRLTGMFVMFAGVGIIGALASILASILVPPPPAREADNNVTPDAAALQHELAQVRMELAALRQLIARENSNPSGT